MNNYNTTKMGMKIHRLSNRIESLEELKKVSLPLVLSLCFITLVLFLVETLCSIDLKFFIVLGFISISTFSGLSLILSLLMWYFSKIKYHLLINIMLINISAYIKNILSQEDQFRAINFIGISIDRILPKNDFEKIVALVKPCTSMHAAAENGCNLIKLILSLLSKPTNCQLMYTLSREGADMLYELKQRVK